MGGPRGPFSKEEIKIVVYGANPNKALGPDGFGLRSGLPIRGEGGCLEDVLRIPLRFARFEQPYCHAF